MCTVLLPPGVNPIAINKFIVSYISYHHISYHMNSDCVPLQHLPLGLSNGSALCSQWVTKWIFTTSVMYTHSPAYHYGSAVSNAVHASYIRM